MQLVRPNLYILNIYSPNRSIHGEKMTLQQLKYYCMVCECHSITQAAKKFFVTQPAVTAAIRELEKEYAVRLVDKEGKSIRLTKAGEGFYQYASQMLDHAKEFDDQVHNMVKHTRNLRIGLTKSAGSAAYMEYFSNEAEKYQNVEIKVTVDSTSELIEKLRDKKLDAVLVLNHGGDPMENDLEWAELKTTEMLYCVSKNHALAHEERITVPMIAKEKMVSTKHDHHKTEALRQLFLQAGYEEGPQVLWRYDQQSTALQMIAANMATGYFPAEAIRQNDGIVGKQLEGDKSVPICIAWTKDSWKQEEVQQFIKGIMKFYGAVR